MEEQFALNCGASREQVPLVGLRPDFRGAVNGKVNICMVAHDSRLYGAPSFLLDLACGLNREAFQPILVFPQPLSQELRERAIQHHVPLFGVRKGVETSDPKPILAVKRLLNRFQLLRSYLRLFRQSRAQLVYLNTIRSTTAALAARLLGIPTLWCIHEMAETLDLAGGPLRLRILRSLACPIVTVTEAARQDLIRRGVPSERVRVIYNGFPIPDPTVVQQSMDRRKAFPRRRISFVGYLSASKDPLTLIRAFHRLADPDLDLWLFGDVVEGDDDYLSVLQDEVRKLALEGRTRFFGRVPDMQAHYPSITINVLPSRMESFGRTLGEAMSWGIPVVASRVGGIPELVTDGQDGLLFQPGDVEGLAGHLRTLLNDPALYDRMSQSALRSMRERFSINRSIHEHEQAMQEAITRQTKAR